MWVTKLLISPVKKRIFCPKTTKFGPKVAFLVNLGLAMQAYLVPCWWVVWWLWRAGCISQDTYLLYDNDDDDNDDYGHDLVDGDDDQLKKGEVRIGPLLPHTSSPAPRRREGQIQFPN